MTIFDYVAIGIVVVSLGLGLWRGVVGELIALAAWVLAVLAAVEFGALTGGLIFAGIRDPGMRTLAGCALVFAGVLVAMALARLAMNKLIKALGLSLSDRLLGLFFGVARGLLVVLVLVAVGGLTPLPRQDWWRDATLSAPLETAVLALKPQLPIDLAKRIRFK